MKKILPLFALLIFSSFVFAQQKIKPKQALPESGLLNKKIKQSKWYFDTYSISDDRLELSGSPGQPDMINFVDEKKFVINLEDSTTISGTYQIFDLQDMGTHNVPPDYKTFRVNKSGNQSARAKKLTVFLEQYLNVHYDLEQKTMDFMSNKIQPIGPAN